MGWRRRNEPCIRGGLGDTQGGSQGPGDLCAQRAAYQQLGGAENIQSEGLDAGIMHTQLPMDPRALNARQDSQVGGKPRGICGGSGEVLNITPSPERCCDSMTADSQPGWGDTPGPDIPGAPQSQHCLFPGIFFTSLMTSLVSSCIPPSSPVPAATPPLPPSPLKALLRASSLLFCSTETHLGRRK